MFTRNYHAMKSFALFSKAPVIATTSGADSTHENGMPNITSLLASLQTSYKAGVVLGTGDTAPTLYDYKLAGDLVTGFTYSYTVTSGKDENGPWARVKYTITNNNTDAVTIREIALLAGSTVCMIERSVLEKAITIEGGGGVGQIEHTVRYDVPTSEPVLNLDQEGVYGVEWNCGSSATKLTRFGDSKDFAAPAPATELETAGSSPFDTLMPWAGMKKYNIVDGAVGASEDDDGFSMTDADTVVYIPEFYYAVQWVPYEQKMRWAISMTEKEGFAKHPGSGRYIGRYHTSTVSSAYSSKSGYKPQVSMPRATARTNSHKKGDKWWLMDYAVWSAIQILYLVEYADWNSQNVLGTGQDSGALVASGGTDEAVYHSLKRSGASNQYRWIEDPWSNCYDFVDGIVSASGTFYLNTENANNGDATANHTSTGKKFSGSGVISRYHFVDKFPWAFIPRTADAAEGTYVTDYAYGDSNGTYIYYVGGSYSAGASCGLFYINNNNTTNNNGNLGARLLVSVPARRRPRTAR